MDIMNIILAIIQNMLFTFFMLIGFILCQSKKQTIYTIISTLFLIMVIIFGAFVLLNTLALCDIYTTKTLFNWNDFIPITIFSIW